MRGNKKDVLSAARIRQAILFRTNPLVYLTASNLSDYHSRFDQGYLRNAALTWDMMEKTDDILMSVAPKRKKIVSRHGFDIVTTEDSPRAEQHAETLKFFYSNLIATSALDLNERGGLPMLIRQMMDSVGKKYSIHELLFQMRNGGLTAMFKHVPLWFFENTTGRLRYLDSDLAQTGVDLQPGCWMVTTGDGIMRACASCWLFKHLPLQDWLIYSEKYGFPVAIGKVEGKPDDDNWTSMEDAIEDLNGGDSIVVSMGAEIEALQLGMSGELPYRDMIDRMDRALAILWRGSDLATMSANNATGASLQDEEKDVLEEDDAANITDVLQEQIDRLVIKYVHGDATPLAWIQIKTAQRQDIKLDLETDKGLKEMGYTDELEDVRARYNRPKLEKEESGKREVGSGKTDALANEAPGADLEAAVQASRNAIAEAVQADLQPAADRLVDILENTQDAELIQALKFFRDRELPALATDILADPTAAEPFNTLLSDAALAGADAVESKVRPDDE